MSLTDNEYRLVEVKQLEDRIMFVIKIEATSEVKGVFLNNYYEGLYIEIDKRKYNIYAEIQDDSIVGEIFWDTVVNNSTEKRDNSIRMWIRNRIGNTYIDYPIFIDCEETQLSFAYNKKYVFLPINKLEWVFCTYSSKINSENPFEKSNSRQMLDFKIQSDEEMVIIYGNIGAQFDESEEYKREICLSWRRVKDKKIYYFHSVKFECNKFVYYLSASEINKFGSWNIEDGEFDWIFVDSEGETYDISLSEGEEIENMKIPAKDFFAEMSITQNNTVRMRASSLIYFDYLGVSENGNELIVGYKKRTYDMHIESIVMQKVNTDIEYKLPFSTVSETADEIIYSIKLQNDIDEEIFKIGIYQFWVEVKDGITVEKYPIKLLRKRKLTENNYIIAEQPYMLIGDNYYNCLFYNDSSNNLKCNSMHKVMKMQILRTEVLPDRIKLDILVMKETYFTKITNVKLIAENGENIFLDYNVKEKLRENIVEISILFEKISKFGVNLSFKVELLFNGRSEGIRLENNMYRPAVSNRETRAFSKIMNSSSNGIIRVWGDYVKNSYTVGISEDLQFLYENGIWNSGEELFVEVGWENEEISEKYKNHQVMLYLRNKITNEEIMFETVDNANEQNDNEGRLFCISSNILKMGEFVVCAGIHGNMKSYLKMKSSPMTMKFSQNKKKIQIKKVDGDLELCVGELLLFENEDMLNECDSIIKKAREENDRKKVWLIGENYGLSARDNGLAFFEYCMKHKSDLDAEVYFVTKMENKDIESLELYMKNVLIYDSLEHIYYDEISEFYIVSHGVRDVMPSLYHNKMGVYHKPIIYLQHGITAMKKVGICNESYGRSIRKFIVSSEQEKNLLVENHQFWEDEIANTGLARYDKLSTEKIAAGKYIWIMPTWRDWLVNSERDFVNSEFYAYYSSILADTELQEKLRKKGQKLLLSLHVEFEKYKGYFEKFENDIVHITDMHEKSITRMVEECSMIITDYSSIIFDVVYQNKPVIFFQFDQKEYSKYRGSYVDLESDLPGAVTHSIEELKEQMLILIQSNFTVDSEYKRRANEYFDYHDGRNSERIYNAIIACREEMADENQN